MNTIRYAFGDSSLGPFVAALSTRGLALVAFDAGRAELESRFPDADLVEDQAAFGRDDRQARRPDRPSGK